MSTGFYVNCYGYDSPRFQVLSLTGGIKESYGRGIVGGRTGGWGIEGGADRVTVWQLYITLFMNMPF
jgi:hypothetical protein